MIVSKALRNIRPKIDFVTLANTNGVIGLWQFNYAFEATTERLDAAQNQAFDSILYSVSGDFFTDTDWHSLFAANGDPMTVAQIANWIKTNKPNMKFNVIARTQANVRITQENDGRYLSLDQTYGGAWPTANFTSLLLSIPNSTAGSLSDNVSCYNFFEISYQDLINMGVPLVNNGDGTYKINTPIDRLHIKISEDV